MPYPLMRQAVSPQDRYPTAELWNTLLELYTPDQVVVSIFDDFLVAGTHAEDVVVDHWILSDAAAGGTATAPTTGSPNGIKTLTDAGGTAHFGASLLRANAVAAVANIPLPSHATVATRRGRVVFEALINPLVTDVIFIGLTDNGADFLSATSTLGDKNYIGFYKLESGDLQFVTSDTAVGAQVTDSAIVLLAANIPTTAFKVGFSVETDRSVQIVVNGVRYPVQGDSISIASLPTASLLPRIEATTGTTTSAVAFPIDWVKIAVAS